MECISSFNCPSSALQCSDGSVMFCVGKSLEHLIQPLFECPVTEQTMLGIIEMVRVVASSYFGQSINTSPLLYLKETDTPYQKTRSGNLKIIPAITDLTKDVLFAPNKRYAEFPIHSLSLYDKGEDTELDHIILRSKNINLLEIFARHVGDQLLSITNTSEQDGFLLNVTRPSSEEFVYNFAVGTLAIDKQCIPIWKSLGYGKRGWEIRKEKARAAPRPLASGILDFMDIGCALIEAFHPLGKPVSMACRFLSIGNFVRRII